MASFPVTTVTAAAACTAVDRYQVRQWELEDPKFAAAPKHDPAGVEVVLVPPATPSDGTASEKNPQIQEFITVKFDHS